MKRALKLPQKNTFKSFSFISAMLLALVVFNPIYGQTKTTIVTKTTTNERIIKGLIANEDGPLVGVNITQKRTKNGTVTNEKGEFIFDQVKPDEAYSFQSVVVDMDSEIRIFNQDGEVIESIMPNAGGEFVYVRLKDSDKIITITNEKNVTVKVAEEEKFNIPSIYFEINESQLSHLAGLVLNNLNYTVT